MIMHCMKKARLFMGNDNELEQRYQNKKIEILSKRIYF